MYRRRWLLIAASILVGALALGGPWASGNAAPLGLAGGSVAAASAPQIPVLAERTRLVYGAPQGVAFAVYVGLERGYFAEANLDVDVENVDVAAIAPNLTTGQIDLGHGPSAPGLFNALARGLPIRAILDASHLAPNGRSHMILARQDLYDGGQVRGVDALRGRRVALNTVASGNAIDLDRSLRLVGMTLDDVEQVQIGFVDQAVALANGSVDAAVTLEPFAGRIVERGVGQPIRYLNQDYPDHQVSFPMIGPRLIERPDVTRAFAVAYLRAARDYERARQFGENVEPVAAALARYTRQDPAQVAATFRDGGMTGIQPDGRIDLTSVQYDIEWYRDHGFVDSALNAASFVDPQYADFALGVLGPFR
jgi:ABC-type nitrate/sulfonate/bicarbonate transport system substrate-binding protein